MPELTSPDGSKFRTESPVEITRLKSRGYVEGVPGDRLFHPGDHKIPDVLAYMADNPQDIDRVLEEERAGQARKGILGE